MRVTEERNFILNEHGQSIVSTLIASFIIIAAIGAIVVPSVKLHRAMKKSEIANITVEIEANLISAFHDKSTFPDPGGMLISPNATLRAGTLPSSLRLPVAFVAGGALNLTPMASGELGVSGFMKKDMSPCPAFDAVCILRYDIRFKPVGGGYAFAYQIDANPDVVPMAPVGKITDYTSPVDPGLYRAEYNLTNCDPVTDLFANGMNRDTGEAYCVSKPTALQCAPGTLPRGLEVVPGGTKAGIAQLKCSTGTLRTYVCPANYSLETFNPRATDPQVTAPSGGALGSCVFRTQNAATTPSSAVFPPTAGPGNYMRSVSATMCPPFYASNGTGCTLVPDGSRNATQGMGRCAHTAYKNCQRSTWTDTVSPNPAYATWLSCSALVPPPAMGCGAMPASTLTARTCEYTQTSSSCNGVVTSGASCTNFTAWDGGTAYAYGFYDVAPSASAAGGGGAGRTVTCTFNDTSPACAAPDEDINGSNWGKKNPKWYGGVQVKNTQCTYSTASGGAEHVTPTLAP